MPEKPKASVEPSESKPEVKICIYCGLKLKEGRCENRCENAEKL
jgi:hypothetical protein